MFYDNNSIKHQFEPLLNKLNSLDLFLFEPMPSYKESKNWTDEFRIRDGHTKLDDGSWVTIHKLTTYVENIQKNVINLHESKHKMFQELDLVKQQNREMEYALRVAARALNNSLNLTKEMQHE